MVPVYKVKDHFKRRGIRITAAAPVIAYNGKNSVFPVQMQLVRGIPDLNGEIRLLHYAPVCNGTAVQTKILAAVFVSQAGLA